jgi:peptidoglycan/xylan/chitin deacetylase (PgdA/CDA1 family)
MTWKRVLAKGISELCAWQLGLTGVRQGFRILLYHAVGSNVDHDTYGISLSPDRFKEQMACLAESLGVRLLSLLEGQAASSSLRIAVTFDDGYKDNLHHAAPILLKYSVPFTIFATSSFIRSGAADYLSPSELRELADLPGVTIGSHGATHVPLAGCDDRTLWKELHESRLYLEDTIGRPVRAVSYPHGSVTRRVAAAAQRAGYVAGACSRFDINAPDRDPLLLCRTEVVALDSERVFRQKLCGAWDWCRWRAQDPAATEGQSA